MKNEQPATNKGSSMMVKRLYLGGLLVLFCFQWLSNISFAGSAEVLPKGISKGHLVTTHYFSINERYDESGDIENLAENYNSVLDSSVFTSLGLMEKGFGLPAGFANIGETEISFELQLTQLNLTYEYGITDKLTAGINIPYYRAKNKVDARIKSDKATVGKSAIGNAFGAPIVPLAGGGPFGDAVALDTNDVQDLIGDGLDVDGNGTINVLGFRLF